MPSAGDVLTFQADNQAPSYQASSGGVLGAFQGRIVYVSSTTLELTPYIGDVIEIAGEMVDVGGLTDAIVSTADNLLNANGGDSGAAPGVPVVGTPVLYYAYVSNSLSAYAPLTFRLSATAPSLDSFNFLYLGAAGDGPNWRFVGAVGLWNDGGGGGGAARFYSQADPAVDRSIVGFANYYNRRAIYPFTCPGYVNDGAATTWASVVAAAWQEFNAGVGSRIWFVDLGEDAVDFQCEINGFDASAVIPATMGPGIGLDTLANPITCKLDSWTPNPQPRITTITRGGKLFTGMGIHYAAALYYSTGNVCTVAADKPGGVAGTPDVPSSFLGGVVHG